MPLHLTKLNHPRPAEGILPRDRLLAQLNRRRSRPLTLVSAPAGYGKTTLISRWIEAGAYPSAWLTLDENDNDLRLFITYITRALENVAPGACGHTGQLLEALNLAPLNAFVESLSNELQRIESNFDFVLDDYYRIKNQTIHDFIKALLHHPPEKMHLTIISRYDPPLQLASYRGRNLMVEIRTRDLRFTTPETADLLKRMTGFELSTNQATKIAARSEGWVTGLRLLVLALRRKGQIDRIVDELPTDAQYAREYLFNEVLARHTADVRQLLMVTALFDRFCGPLCDALVSAVRGTESIEISGWDFIATVRKKNLFVVPLDIENHWFRYHHIFQKLLSNQLRRHYSREAIDTLHLKASDWFAENGLIEEAQRHALAAGAMEAAGRLVAQFGHQLINDQQWPRLGRLLNQLPRNRIDRDPALLILRAWLDHIQHNVSGVVAGIEKIEAIFKTPSPTSLDNIKYVQGHFETMQGFVHYMAAKGGRALANFQRALDLIPPHHKRARLLANNGLAAAYQMTGDLMRGLTVYQKAMDPYVNTDDNYHAMYLAKLGLIYWMDADLPALEKTAESIGSIAMKASRSAISPYYRLYFMGIIHYLRNELRPAEEMLTEVVKAHYAASPINFAHSAFALALTYQAQGKNDRARKNCQAVIEDSIVSNNMDMLQVARAFEAELALSQGRYTEAFQWARRYQGKPLLPVYRFYMPQLTFIKTLLARDTPDSCKEAADLLEELWAYLKVIHNRRFQIDVLVLKALWLDRKGQTREAIASLGRALELGEPGGFIRPFVDLGPPMAALLERFNMASPPNDYRRSVISAFGKGESKTVLADVLMSNRELDILSLLSQRLRNKEIAEELFISPETVKKHLYNIYKKFGVNKRRQAVTKAEEMGIIARR